MRAIAAILLLLIAVPSFADEVSKKALIDELITVLAVEHVERTLVNAVLDELLRASTTAETRREIGELRESMRGGTPSREIWTVGLSRLQEKDIARMVEFYRTETGRLSLAIVAAFVGRYSESLDDDIIYSNGTFVQAPKDLPRTNQ